MSLSEVAALAIAAVGSVLAPYALRPLLARWGIVDVPNHRSSHSSPTLRGGGMAPAIGLLAGFAVLLPSVDHAAAGALWILIAGTIAATLLGLSEDVAGVAVHLRLALQLVIGVSVGAAIAVNYGIGWWCVPAVMVMIAAYINVANFMDGVDGISGLHAIVAGSSFALLGFLSGLWWLTLAGLMIALVFAGFLAWNLRPPGLFLGDAGSYLLGAYLSITAVLAFLSGLSLIASVAPFAIYGADTVVIVVRRVLAGERWYESHRRHVYQRLVDSGLSHGAVATTVTIFTLLAGAFGAMSLMEGPLALIVSALGVTLLIGVYLSLPSIRAARVRKPVASAVGSGS